MTIKPENLSGAGQLFKTLQDLRLWHERVENCRGYLSVQHPGYPVNLALLLPEAQCENIRQETLDGLVDAMRIARDEMIEMGVDVSSIILPGENTPETAEA